MGNKTSLILSRSELYSVVTRKASELGFNVFSRNYRIDACDLAMRACLRPQIRLLDFTEAHVCGVLYRGDNTTTIGLNVKRSAVGRNFDCMHELIHYWYHEGASFYCVADVNNNIEWQANEGAAQFLMPYQNFIPKYCYLHDEFYNRLSPAAAHDALIGNLAKNYMVGERAVQIRIKSLSAEIARYVDGTPIDEIKIVSGRK